jgi:hypothetical protein
MAKIGRSLTDLAQEIERRAAAKADFVAPASKLEMVVVNDAPALAMHNGTVHTFTPTEIANGQIAEYAGIPMAYYRRMMANDPQLLATNVNRWLQDKAQAGDKRMLRTMDGKARALLSDRYRTLENEDLASAVLPVLLDRNLLIISCEVTDARLYIKAVDRSIERDVPTGKKMGDASHTFFDTCSPAISISNSEVGSGALSVETGVYTRVCTNLAMIGTNMRKYHTGARMAGGVEDAVYAMLTDETKQASDKAVWLQTRDMVAAAFDNAKFDAMCAKLGNAAQDVVPAEQVVEVVKRVSRRYSLTEGEGKGVLAALIADGDLTRYGVHSALTRFSQVDAVDYDRATELERIGGDVIELGANDWRALVAA